MRRHVLTDLIGVLSHVIAVSGRLRCKTQLTAIQYGTQRTHTDLYFCVSYFSLSSNIYIGLNMHAQTWTNLLNTGLKCGLCNFMHTYSWAKKLTQKIKSFMWLKIHSNLKRPYLQCYNLKVTFLFWDGIFVNCTQNVNLYMYV